MWRLQEEISTSEFFEWCAYFQAKDVVRTKQDYYLAAIALQIARSGSKHPGKLKLEDFLLEFGDEAKGRSYSEQFAHLPPEERRKAVSKVSRSQWKMILAQPKKNKPKVRALPTPEEKQKIKQAAIDAR